LPRSEPVQPALFHQLSGPPSSQDSATRSLRPGRSGLLPLLRYVRGGGHGLRDSLFGRRGGCPCAGK
jgi:hypothetical protein